MQRNTRQRAMIAALLDETDDFVSAQTLHERLRAQGDSVGLATVYRTLQTFADSGAVDVLSSADGEALYRRCEDSGHHHHLVCRRCGRTVEITPDGFEAWASAVAREHGFSDLQHTLEVFGLCGDCAAGKPAGHSAQGHSTPGGPGS